MVDWYVLLIPLVLAPIAALLVFVGCAIDGEGEAPNDRTIIVRYKNIPWKANPVAEVTAFYFVPGFTVSPNSVKQKVQWTSEALDAPIEEGQLPFALFPKDGAVDCTCMLTLTRSDGQEIQPSPSKTLKGEDDASIEFELTYQAWPGTPDYSGASFSLHEAQ
jgi:hypothetical protein